jgi:hypothetical protein
MYEFYNENPLGVFEDDCVVRSISCATNRSWDSVYDELSDLAQANGTLLDNKHFVRWYLDSHFKRITNPPYKVYQVARNFKNNIVLCTMRGHICCIKYGRILDTFNPSDRVVEDVWVVE